MKKILILMCCGVTAFSQTTLLTNLQGCYPLDLNALNYAPTGASNNATSNNATSSTGHGLIANTAYQFSNSGQQIILSSNPSLKPMTEITVSGWYYISSNVNTSNFPNYLVYTRNNMSSYPAQSNLVAAYSLSTAWNGSFLCFVLQKSSSTASSPVYLTSNPIILNQWYHVVFYLSNTVAKLWVDNTPPYIQNHNVLFEYYTPQSLPVVLGNSADPLLPFGLVGKIDNVRFYDRQLSTSEINDLYTNDPNCTSAGTTPPPPPPPPPIPGNYCSGVQNGLTADYQVALNGFNYNFTTPANTAAKVIIGRTTCTGGQARLVVGDDNIGVGIHGSSSTNGTSSNIGIKGSGMDLSTNAPVTTYGVVGEARQPNDNPSAYSAGLAGFCGGMNSSSMPPGENIGVYGNSLASNGKWAGYFDGDVKFNGIVWGSQNVWVSDKRFKKSINELKDVSTKLKNMKGYSYLYNTEEFKNRNFSKSEQIGFIAQELKAVFPQLVLEDAQGYLGVNYVGFIPVLLQAHKEQQTQIENQQQQLDELKALVQSLSGTNLGSKNKAPSTVVELSDKNTIVLNQNVPNPFAETTVINYNVPTDFSKAQILFSTSDGKVIKVIDITEKGAGSLHVFANDLSHGLYSYTLVVDGKTIDTKKMIKD